MILAVLVLGRVSTSFYVELLWYGSEGYTAVFLRRLIWLWAIRLLVAVVVAMTLVVNLRLVARTLGGIQIKRRFGNLEISEQLPQSYISWSIGAASVLLGTWFGASVTEGMAWAVLVALQGVEWGLVEPVLGHDVGYYVFVLPLLQRVLTFLMVLTFLLLTCCLGGYAATGAVSWGRQSVLMGNQPRRHLGTIVSAFMLLVACRFLIGRQLLILSGTSAVQGIFGYADSEARLPALLAMSVLTLGAALAVQFGAWRNRLVPVVAGLGVVALGTLVGVQFYPSLVQRFRVQPNELDREAPFIEWNLEFTRRGFGLADLERRPFEYEGADSVAWTVAREQFAGLPVWTPSTLLTTFRALESFFRYYDFEGVHFDRYPDGVGGTPVPVAISVREIAPDGIEDPNWQNVHLRGRYIAGMGAVAAAVRDRTPEGRPPMHLSAIPPEFGNLPGAPPSLRLTRPQVFFASRPQQYAVVNTAELASALAGVEGVPGRDSPSGIVLDGWARKLAFAWYFRDANLLFAAEVTDSSRLVFRRHVAERAREIAPFFRYPDAPYPVIADGRIVWILEGFTATRYYPLSQPHDLEFRAAASYVRNSVKVTVDALTGESRFYALPERDPLRDAYGLAFPGLLRPLDQMPAEIRAHLRYPRTLMNLQSTVLLQYHQETAPRFHGQQDVWGLPTELLQSTSPVPYQPEYGIYRLPSESMSTFNLTTVFVPAGRQNLTAILAARLSDEGTPELILFDVPVEAQAPGPRQVEALVEQDPLISQQFSLWRTGGSRVWTGHLHVVPAGRRLLYMEAVFLAAEADAIPELRRFVVSDGTRVSMEETLEQAIVSLAGAPLAQMRREGLIPSGTGFPTSEDVRLWPQNALDLLEEVEERLRAGDWEGFGLALAELRQLLLGLSSQHPGEEETGR